MKYAFAVALVATAAFQSSAIGAQSDPASRYAQWEHRLRERVNAELAYPIAASGASGDVFVAFTIGVDGKPSDASVQRSSGNPIFDNAALRLVSHLGRLGPVPSFGRNMDQVVLKLSYGDGAKTVSDAIKVGRADREEQLANERRDRALVSTAARIAENH